MIKQIEAVMHECSCELEIKALRSCMIALMLDSTLNETQLDLLDYHGIQE